MSPQYPATYAATSHARLPLPVGDTPFRLRFQSLFHPGRGLSFPCDAQGVVALDALSERARQNYLYARAVVGREYASPAVELADV
jgi:hypothetical protein